MIMISKQRDLFELIKKNKYIEKKAYLNYNSNQ